MNKKLFLFFFIKLIISSETLAQTVFGNYFLDHWDSKRGLPSDLVLGLFKDHDGYIWISGYDGLMRFDGHEFKIFNHNTDTLFPSNSVYRVFQDDNNTLWIPTTNNKLLSYDSGRFKSYTSSWPLSRIETILNGHILLYTNINGHTVIFNTESRQFERLDQKQLHSLLLKAKGETVLTEIQGHKFYTSNRSLYAISKDKLDSISMSNANQFCQTSNGELFLIANEKLYTWNGRQFILYPGATNLGFQSFGASRKGLIVEDHQQNIWLATVQGLALRKAGSKVFETLPDNHPFKSIFVTCIQLDDEENLWLGTESGLYKVTESKIRVYSSYDGFATKRVAGAGILDTNTYFVNTPGTANFYKVSPQVIEPYRISSPLLNGRSIELFQTYNDRSKNIWGISANFILQIQPDGRQIVRSYPAVFRSVYEDQYGKMWFGAQDLGVAALEQDTLRWLWPKTSFKGIDISSINQFRDGQWLITTFSYGLLRIDQSGRKTRYYDTLGLPGIGTFKTHIEDNGAYFTVTNAGLYYWDGRKFKHISSNDKIFSTSFFDFIQDNQGNIWLPTQSGIVRISKSSIFDFIKDSTKKLDYRIFDTGDGLLTNQCTGARHSALTPDGKVLIPMLFGLAEINPQKIVYNKVIPKITINPINFNGDEVQEDSKKAFPPGYNQFVFSFSALSTTAPEKVLYKYMLEGYDLHWSEPTKESKSTYTNLPKGHYTFKVIAANNDGIWNESPATVGITVAPFYYETWWFKLFTIAFLIASVTAYIKYRNKSILTRNKELNEQVADKTKALRLANHDLQDQKASLENTLDRLQSTQAQLIQSEKMASLGELTAGIAHEIQNPLNFVNNFSEVNTELIKEMMEEVDKGNTNDVKSIAKDLVQNLEKINHHGKRASEIVKGMLQHSRSNSGVNEPTDINALVDEYLRLAYHGLRAKDKTFNATMKTDFEESIGHINIIPQEIGRVLLNLINNAFYAVAEKSKQNSPGYQPTVEVSTKKEDNKILVIVKDNGNGIPQKILDKIFQPFFTTKPAGQGTGLGLSLSYDIIKAHGGQIRVETKEGQESTFIIQLPTA